MYIWYKITQSNDECCINDVSGIKISVFKPKIGGVSIPNERLNAKTLLLRVYFSLITNWKLQIYYVEDEGKIIHTSYVIPGCWKFPFIKNGELEIGPCQTVPEYRGRGIYPAVLKRIISDNKGVPIHMIVEEKNSSSIKGIEKAGFQRVGFIVVTAFKRYKEYKGS